MAQWTPNNIARVNARFTVGRESSRVSANPRGQEKRGFGCVSEHKMDDTFLPARGLMVKILD